MTGLLKKLLRRKKRYTILTVIYDQDLTRSWICENETMARDTLYWWAKSRWDLYLRGYRKPYDHGQLISEFYKNNDESYIISDTVSWPVREPERKYTALVINGECGPHVWMCEDAETAWNVLDDWVVSWWDDEAGNQQMPKDADVRRDLYFDASGESWDMVQVTVTRRGEVI